MTSSAPRSSRETAPRSSRETVLPAAVEVAKAAVLEVEDPASVGAHQGFELLAPRMGNHYFECLLPGYRGWRWAVTLVRVPRGRTATIAGVDLVAGEDALTAPNWVPWKDRLRPDDVSDADVLPYIADDARLIQGWEDTGEHADQANPWELGLGRERVLSDFGRSTAIQRWYDSEQGPSGRKPRRSAPQCSTCGFLMLLAGSARTVIGVCANEWSQSDGKVVSLDHGCGAHSQSRAPEPAQLWDASEPVRDDCDLDIVATAQ